MQINNASYGLSNDYYNKTSSNSLNNEQTQNSNGEQSSNQNNKQTQMVNGVELDAKQLQTLRELQSVDRNVKAHEAAHQAAGGGLTGAASFSYTRGPDNQMYATAGEVPIRMRQGNTPEQTIAIARQIVAAAMAPADPSPQDYKVAANATKMEIQARAEAMKIQAEEAKQNSSENENSNSNQSGNSQNEQNNNGENNNINRDFKAFVANAYQRNSTDFNYTLNLASWFRFFEILRLASAKVF